MVNYKLTIEYDGRKFNGWQRQKATENTIQEQIENSLQKIFKKEIRIIGSGRTDAGVSALNQVANFHFEGDFDKDKLKYSLNSILPAEITIKNIGLVKPEFHARFSALKRQYFYKICLEKRSVRADEFYKINYVPDLAKIEKFTGFIKNQKNFRIFCKNKEDKHDFNCEISEFDFRYNRLKKELIFKITANRFLHSMVRAIIGCALEVGRGKIKLDDIRDKIKKGEKIRIHYLPAKALFLNKIYY
ncbi:MAG TPA: tRNA pseudouridine(38-40) synthase TruA [Ignavibacteria bacterium]|nr:tRNA pseudouridine(38-40) synthase TruA [Ignavibacteria bacterium]HMR39785.1 tRNA pseudouridine(38-40) synthase TruA [Ignavibacteria bacterium]